MGVAGIIVWYWVAGDRFSAEVRRHFVSVADPQSRPPPAPDQARGWFRVEQIREIPNGYRATGPLSARGRPRLGRHVIREGDDFAVRIPIHQVQLGGRRQRIAVDLGARVPMGCVLLGPHPGPPARAVIVSFAVDPPRYVGGRVILKIGEMRYRGRIDDARTPTACVRLDPPVHIAVGEIFMLQPGTSATRPSVVEVIVVDVIAADTD